MTHQIWNEHNIEHLLELDAVAPGQWRTRYGDSNLNGRSYGGQLLGQTMRAALMDVPEDRSATMMQFLFIQGAMPEEALNLQVTRLQEGKRFSSRHVRASQGNGRTILDAQVTCATWIDAPDHAAPSTAPPHERPETLAELKDVDPVILQSIPKLGGYSNDHKPSIEFRIPQPNHQFNDTTLESGFRFWMRPTQPLPDDPRLHAGVFAYMSDWWLNFSSLKPHLHALGDRRLYVTSLNHAMWLHRPFRADQWLHVRTHSSVAGQGRGLSLGSVHDQEGRALASLTQECLMAYAD